MRAVGRGAHAQAVAVGVGVIRGRVDGDTRVLDRGRGVVVGGRRGIGQVIELLRQVVALLEAATRVDDVEILDPLGRHVGDREPGRGGATSFGQGDLEIVAQGLERHAGRPLAGPRLEAHRVGAAADGGPLGDPVGAVAKADGEGIVPHSTAEHVVARPADERVVAGPAVDRVRAAAAVEAVVGVVAYHRVVAVARIDVLDGGAGGNRQGLARHRAGGAGGQVDDRVGGDRRRVDGIDAAIVAQGPAGRGGGGGIRIGGWIGWGYFAGIVWISRVPRIGLERLMSVEASAGDGLARERREGVDRVEQCSLDLGGGEGRVVGPQEADRARHVGRRHGGAAQAAVAVVRHGAVDADPGRAEVDRGGAPLGEIGEVVVVVRRGHRDDVVEIVGGRIGGAGVVVVGAVPGRRDEEGAGVPGGRDGVVEGLVVAPAAPAVVGDLRAHGGRILDGADRVEEGARAARAQELQRHDLGRPGDARDADAVIAVGGNGARDMGAVVVVVPGIAVVVDEIVAVIVVDVAVAVVVDAIVRDLARVHPHVLGEVRVVVIHTRIDDADDDVGAGLDIPGLGRVDVGVGGAAGLPGVVEAPERAQGRVVRDRVDRERVVGLHILDEVVARERGQRVLDAAVDLPELDAEPLGGAEHLGAGGRREFSRHRRRHGVLEFHDQLAGRVVLPFDQAELPVRRARRDDVGRARHHLAAALDGCRGARLRPARLVGDIGEFVRIDVEVVGAGRVAVEAERPGIERAAVSRVMVLDRERPGAFPRLAPVVGAGKGEVDVVLARAPEGPARALSRPVQEHALGAVRRCQLDDQVADPGVIDVERDLDLVDVHAGIEGHRIGDGAVVDDGLVGGAARAQRKFVRARALQVPGLGQAHGGEGVDEAEAEIVTGVEGAAVPVAGPIPGPARVALVHHARRIGQDLLDVAIAEVGVGLEHEGDDAGRDRRGGRGATEGRGVVTARVAGRAGAVRGRDTGDAAVARAADEDGGTGGAVVADLAGIVDRRHGDGLARVLEAVVVGVLALETAVAGGEQDDVAEAAAAIGDGRVDGGAHAREGRRIEIVEEVAVIAPAVVGRVEADMAQEGVRQLRVGHGAAEDTETGDGRVVGDADRARPVPLRRDQAGDGGAVKVAGAGRRVAVVAAVVIVQRSVVIAVEIGVRVLDTVIDDTDIDTGPGIVVPHAGHVDIDARLAAALARVEQMPLRGEEPVARDQEDLGPGCGRYGRCGARHHAWRGRIGCGTRGLDRLRRLAAVRGDFTTHAARGGGGGRVVIEAVLAIEAATECRSGAEVPAPCHGGGLEPRAQGRSPGEIATVRRLGEPSCIGSIGDKSTSPIDTVVPGPHRIQWNFRHPAEPPRAVERCRALHEKRDIGLWEAYRGRADRVRPRHDGSRHANTVLGRRGGVATHAQHLAPRWGGGGCSILKARSTRREHMTKPT